MSDTKENTPTLIWDSGTAYELFVSLYVLYNSDFYGIRASWAAGIRSRIPAVERKMLDDIMPFFHIPLPWMYELPAPKDAISALWALRQIPAAERMIRFMCLDRYPGNKAQPLIEIAKRGSWTDTDAETLAPMLIHAEKPDQGSVKRYLDWWTRPAEFGDLFLSAMQAYYQGFFEEEEKRVGPVLKQGLENARELAGRLAPAALLTELSQGIKFEPEVTSVNEMILIPAYWTTPLVVFDHSAEQSRSMFLFGVRPANMSVVPGEMVPDGLVRTLKAIADPTRLKILYYLAKEEMTPSELARRLHLRAPTVTHHLTEMRLAGLVYLNTSGQERRYSARREAIDQTLTNLQEFLDKTNNLQ
jgi:DNA-binding transcriptional ArsR family regulator